MSDYVIKYEELKRAVRRLKKFYNEFVQDGEDSFQGPKDYAKIFRISYELKESIKNSTPTFQIIAKAIMVN